LKLNISRSISACRQIFVLFSVLEAYQAQFDFDLSVAYWDTMLRLKNHGKLFRFQVPPKHAAVSRASRFVPIYQNFQQGGCIWELGKIFSCRLQNDVGDPLEFELKVPVKYWNFG
jgi:hypothetical protein